MGHDPKGRRHASPAWLSLITVDSPIVRGRKLVVQLAETFKAGRSPTFVDSLDAIDVGRKIGAAVAPVMIYGDDVSHVVTEEGIAYLFKAAGIEERRAALAAVAGATSVGSRAQRGRTDSLRARGIVAYPTDLGVDSLQASRSMLAARSIQELVAWSGGLYRPPSRFRSW